MIKAVIFDCFGVLVQGTFGAFREKHFPGDEIKIRRMQELDDLASRGHMTHLEFVAELAGLAGISEEQVTRETNKNPPNEKLFAYIEQKLRGTYKIGLLSNAAENWLSDLFTEDQRRLFDNVVLSCEVSLAKPDARIFEIAADRLQMLPAECIFVDDSARYCTGAETVGMKTICYKDFAQFEQDLPNLLQ